MLSVIYIGKAYKVGRKDRTKLYKLGWTEKIYIKWGRMYIKMGGQSQAIKGGADRAKLYNVGGQSQSI